MPNTAPPARYDLLGDAPDGLVADKMVEVCLCDGGVQWVLIHVEVRTPGQWPAWWCWPTRIPAGSRTGFRTRLAKAIDEQMATWSDALLAAQSLKQVFG